MKKAKAENPQLLDLINLLKKAARENNARIWGTIAETMSKSRNRRVAVNLSQINRHTERGQVAAIPGKVLGSGALNHPTTVVAFAFSTVATGKIKKARGKCLTFPELVKKNPKGSNVKIVG
jgi:large subunit ribosomal protein L18e